MQTPSLAMSIACLLLAVTVVSAQESGEKKEDPLPTTAERPTHQESAARHDGPPPPSLEAPPLPADMTLEEVLARAAQPPPASYPDPVPDDRIFWFFRFDQFEYRFAEAPRSDHLGWESDGWIGGDFQKFWWKSEGEAVFDGVDEGESENDFLYSRLITPFWNAQIGVQYASEWSEEHAYEDRWSGVIALQGLAPYKFELDTSVLVSEDGDWTLAFEGEYDIRVTQRLVLQPRASVRAAAQDVPERGLGAGLTGLDLDVRLRYEIRREFAPYLGVRGRYLLGETGDLAEAGGADSSWSLWVVGVRWVP